MRRQNMYYERKLRDKRKTIWLLGLGLLFMMITLMHTDKIMAATSSGYAANGVQKNVTEYLPTGQNGENTTVGRYALNYTCNINVYSSPSPGNDDVTYRSQTLRGWSNSSMGTLYGDNNTTKVVKAYLIWETRARYVTPFVISLIPVAAYGLCRLFEQISRIKKKAAVEKCKAY